MKTITVLPINVYRNNAYGDCSNNGISAQFETLYLACEDGFMGVEEDDPRLVKLVVRHLFGRDYAHLEPMNPEHPTNAVGPMAGGNFGYTSDSRFPSDYPLPIHDRYETQQQYDALSH